MDIAACQGVRIITCRGAFRAMGEAIGETLRAVLQAQIGAPPADADRARIQQALAPAEQAMPEIMDAMRGMEHGANLPAGALLAEWAKRSKNSMFPDACSNVIFRDGPQGPLWGKNSDDDWVRPFHRQRPGPAERLDHICILRMYPDHGIPVINCTYTGWIAAGDMLNAEGVAAGFSSGGSPFQQSPYHLPDRLWMAAGMFRARTAEDYARHLTAMPLRGKGFLGVVVDRAGGMVAPEIMPPLVQLRRARPEMRGMCCSNCYQLPELAELSGRAHQENARGRAAMLATAIEAGDRSPAYMQAVLRHHGEFDICRHGAPRHDDGFTEYSTIGIPRAGKLLFCAGNPCQGKYDEIGY